MEAEATRTVGGADRVGVGTPDEFSRLRDECAAQLQRSCDRGLTPLYPEINAAPQGRPALAPTRWLGSIAT